MKNIAFRNKANCYQYCVAFVQPNTNPTDSNTYDIPTLKIDLIISYVQWYSSRKQFLALYRFLFRLFHKKSNRVAHKE